MPLYIRDLGMPYLLSSPKYILIRQPYLGMGLVTSVLWLFYFVIGITWPSYVKAFTSFGAFMWYFAWCIIGLVLIYLCVYFPSFARCPQNFDTPRKVSSPKPKAKSSKTWMKPSTSPPRTLRASTETGLFMPSDATCSDRIKRSHPRRRLRDRSSSLPSPAPETMVESTINGMDDDNVHRVS